MNQAIDKWTTRACCLLLLGILLACKKKTDEPAPVASTLPPPAVSIAPLPVAAASAVAQAAIDAGAAAKAPALGAVKRFPGKEKSATGAVRVTVDNSPVYDDPDDKTSSVASLTKDILVERLATIGSDWILVEFPSGVGKLSPGWIDAKSVGAQVPAVSHASVAAQSATATLSSSAKPAASAVPATSAKPAVSAAASAATAPAAASAPPAATVKRKPQLIARPTP